MANPRFFIEGVEPGAACAQQGDASGDCFAVVLNQSDLHHLVNVARVRRGEHVELVVRGTWESFAAVIAEAGSDGVTVRELTPLTVDESTISVHLLFGLPKGDRADTIVRQAVEIGVTSLTPVLFSRSVVRLTGEKAAKRGDRLRKVAESAAKQAHRSSIPQVADPVPLASALDAVGDNVRIIVLWEEASGSLAGAVESDIAAGVREFVLVVGPEGGIDAREIESLRSRGAAVTGLGSSILRVDTACAVACAVALHVGEHTLAQVGCDG